MRTAINMHKKLETYNTFLNKLYFERVLGKPFNIKRVIILENEVGKLCAQHLKTSKVKDKFFFYCLDRLSFVRSLELMNKLNQEKSNIIVKDGEFSLKWNQFFGMRLTLPTDRRNKITKRFMEKSALLLPIILKRFDIIKKTYHEYGSSPSEYFEALEGIQFPEFVSLLQKKSLQTEEYKTNSNLVRDIISSKYLCEDYYYKRQKLLSSISFNKKIKIEKVLWKFSHHLGFKEDSFNILIGKGVTRSPMPFCALIRIPDKIAIYLPNNKNNFSDFYGALHESGHYLHFKSIPKSAGFEDKYCYSLSQIEFFPLVFQHILKNHRFLKQFLKLDDSETIKIAENIEIIELMSLKFYHLNSLFSIYLNKLVPPKSDKGVICKEYELLHEKLFGHKIHGEFWLYHHLLPYSLTNSCSVFLSLLQSRKFCCSIEKRYGESWWQNTSAGNLIKCMMKQGSKLEISKL